MSTRNTKITIRVEFGGGLELLFCYRRKHKITIPSLVSVDNNTATSKLPLDSDTDTDTKPADVEYLIHHLRDHLLQERAVLFMENDTVYVLITRDWLA